MSARWVRLESRAAGFLAPGSRSLAVLGARSESALPLKSFGYNALSAVGDSTPNAAGGLAPEATTATLDLAKHSAFSARQPMVNQNVR
jgi:hypothetical protein